VKKGVGREVVNEKTHLRDRIGGDLGIGWGVDLGFAQK